MKLISRRVFAIGLLAALVLMMALVLTASAAGSAMSWHTLSQTTPFAWTRFDAETITIAGKTNVCVMGGRDGSNNTQGGIMCSVDGVNWTQVATMPTPISNYKIAKLTQGGVVKLFTFGGRHSDGTIGTEVQWFDGVNVGTDTANPWPGMTPSVCVSLPAMGVDVDSNKAYVFGGASFASSGCFDDNSAQIWQYDPNASGARWKMMTSTLTVARGYITTTSVGSGKVLLIGGDVNSAGSLIPQTVSEGFSTTDKVVALASLPEGCDESQAYFNPSSGMALVAGCGQWPGAVGDNLLFSLSTKTWSTATFHLCTARRNHAGFLKGSTPVVFGGYDSGGFNTLNSIEAFNTAPGGCPILPIAPAAAGKADLY